GRRGRAHARRSWGRAPAWRRCCPVRAARTARLDGGGSNDLHPGAFRPAGKAAPGFSVATPVPAGDPVPVPARDDRRLPVPGAGLLAMDDPARYRPGMPPTGFGMLRRKARRGRPGAGPRAPWRKANAQRRQADTLLWGGLARWGAAAAPAPRRPGARRGLPDRRRVPPPVPLRCAARPGPAGDAVPRNGPLGPRRTA